MCFAHANDAMIAPARRRCVERKREQKRPGLLRVGSDLDRALSEIHLVLDGRRRLQLLRRGALRLLLRRLLLRRGGNGARLILIRASRGLLRWPVARWRVLRARQGRVERDPVRRFHYAHLLIELRSR